MSQLRARYRLFNNYKDYFKRVEFLNTSQDLDKLLITFEDFKTSLLELGMLDEFLKVDSETNMPFFGFEVEKIWEKYILKKREIKIDQYLKEDERGGTRMNAFDMEHFLSTRFETREILKVLDISKKLIHELN